MKNIYQEDVVIEGKEYTKTTVITITTTVSCKHSSDITSQKTYDIKEFIRLLCALNPNKKPTVIRDSFKKQLKRRLQIIEEKGLSLPVPLYETGLERHNFYIVQSTEPCLFTAM